MYLNIALIVVCILFIISVLLQNRGSGLGAAFGGDSGNVYRTKRGAEKIVFITSIVLAIIFMVLAFANFLYPNI